MHVVTIAEEATLPDSHTDMVAYDNWRSKCGMRSEPDAVSMKGIVVIFKLMSMLGCLKVTEAVRMLQDPDNYQNIFKVMHSSAYIFVVTVFCLCMTEPYYDPCNIVPDMVEKPEFISMMRAVKDRANEEFKSFTKVWMCIFCLQ